MNRVWQLTAQILTGLFATALCALPQAYTISAKPGVVSYVEGSVLLNGQPVSSKDLKSVFMNANDVLSSDQGKAEVLLTPGVFLRLGGGSQIRMISPSLVNTQLEIQRGEAMIEVDEFVKDNRLAIVDHGASITILKPGLYRFTADAVPAAAVIEGKALVYFGAKSIEIGKGRQTLLGDDLASTRFDSKAEDDLYLWSNIRSQYNASLSYRAAREVSYNSYSSYGSSSYGYSSYGYGGGGLYGPGWYWNNSFNSWLWLPSNAAFFSPFGWGFYGPGVVAYAPVVYVPVIGGAGGVIKRPGGTPVAISPKHPPAIALFSASPAADRQARVQTMRSLSAQGGFRTASGAPAPQFTSSRSGGGAQPAPAYSHASAGGSASGGGGHASSSGGFSSAASSSAGASSHSSGGGASRK